jgi:hypothetical protein
VRFRVYPDLCHKRGLYFLVIVWPDLASMRARLRELCPQSDFSDTRACSVPITRGWFDERGRRQTRPICGELHFARGQFASETIAHEAVHAMFAWARRRGIVVEDEAPGSEIHPNEERFAHLLGMLVGQIVMHGYRLKIFARSRPSS